MQKSSGEQNHPDKKKEIDFGQMRCAHVELKGYNPLTGEN